MTTQWPMSFADELDAAMGCRHNIKQHGTGQIVVTTTGAIRLVYVVMVHDVPGGAIVSRGGQPVIAITMPSASTELLAHLLGSALEEQIETDIDQVAR